MVNYNYLGYGTTDSNGIAKLEYDANGDPLTHSYTGTGAGEIDIVASLDNPIASGSIQSETYILLDALFYDMGTDPDNPNTKYSISNTFERIITTDGTAINYIGSGSTAHCYIAQTNNSDRPFSVGTVIEFEILESSRMAIYVFNSNSTNLGYQVNNVTGIFKAVIGETDTVMYLDDVQVASKSTSEIGSNFSFRFTTSTTNATIKFKNLKIYPV